MRVSARGIAITPRERLSATGAQGCSNGWLKQEVLKEERESVYRQGNSNCLLRLMCGSIKFQRSGSRLRCDLDEPMAFVMVIGNEVFGECVEAINAA